MSDGKTVVAALGEERAILAAAADAADERAWRVATEIYGTLKAGALIAALDEVLKLADEWEGAPWSEDGGDRANVAVEQIRLDGGHLRAAISRALLGEDGSDA
jgi:hypothetical protein